MPTRALFTLAAVLPLAFGATPCNTDNAMQQSTYQATFTYQATTLTVSGNYVWTSATPSSSASDEDELEFETNTDAAGGWLELGEIAQGDLGVFRRDVDEDFECGESSDVCLINSGMVPFCVKEPSGDYYSADGTVGNVVSGNYVVDGQSGNVYSGPCPGEHYEWNSEETYCEAVPAAASEGETASSSATPSSTVSPQSDGSGSSSGGQSGEGAAASVKAGLAAVMAVVVGAVALQRL